MKTILNHLGLSALLAAAALAAADSTPAAPARNLRPTWDLSRDPIDPAGVQGKIECAGGVVKLDTTNSFAIPTAALGAQSDYTIEFEFRRADRFTTLPRVQGALSLVSNRDAAAHAGLAVMYFPPAWDLNGGVSNRMGMEVNGYWNGECAGLDGEAFNQYAIVVKNRSASIYRNGLLLAITGEVQTSRQPLTIGGPGWRGAPTSNIEAAAAVPEPYELRHLRVYDQALPPANSDPNAEMMRNVAGEGYSIQRAELKDPALPRILVIGDSISMGYRGFITQHFKGKAYVDYWVGGSWLDPHSVKGENSKVKTAWTGVLSNGPYDVISWNSMTLHMWKPEMPGRCLESNHADNMAEVIAHIRKTSPASRLIWIRCTPITTAVDGGPSLVDVKKSERLVKFNRITDAVMAAHGIPEIDLYALCERNLDKASKDGVHWNPDASALMAGEINAQIETMLARKP